MCVLSEEKAQITFCRRPVIEQKLSILRPKEIEYEGRKIRISSPRSCVLLNLHTARCKIRKTERERHTARRFSVIMHTCAAVMVLS